MQNLAAKIKPVSVEKKRLNPCVMHFLTLSAHQLSVRGSRSELLWRKCKRETPDYDLDQKYQRESLQKTDEKCREKIISVSFDEFFQPVKTPMQRAKLMLIEHTFPRKQAVERLEIKNRGGLLGKFFFEFRVFFVSCLPRLV